ncbi:hypothetical protein PHLGIDRAFT_36621, partial [Phlebiopsis gigantea 11061_1 CR5-6]
MRRNTSIITGIGHISGYINGSSTRILAGSPPSLKVKRDNFALEACTVRFVAANTSIPVPRVIASAHGHGYQYMFMRRIKGVSLRQVWGDISDGQRSNIVSQLTTFIKEFRELTPPSCIPSGAHVSGFHLALVAIEEDESGREWRMLWQATNRPVPAQSDIPAYVEWSLDIREHINVGNSKLCLGVIIGELKKDDINALRLVVEETAVQVDDKLLLNHENAVVFNCQRWTEMVIIQKLIPRGWASPSIASMQSLLPTLCEAAENSQAQTTPIFVEYN